MQSAVHIKPLTNHRKIAPSKLKKSPNTSKNNITFNSENLVPIHIKNKYNNNYEQDRGLIVILCL